MQRDEYHQVFYGDPLPNMAYNDIEAARAECRDLRYMSIDELMAERHYLIDALGRRQRALDAGKPEHHGLYVMVMGVDIPEPRDAVQWMMNRIKEIDRLIERQRGGDRGRKKEESPYSR